MTTVALIDYGMGNVRSVANALNAIGCGVSITRDAGAIRSADRIVLPGVGAFGDGMENLRRFGLIDVLREEVLAGAKPFLGICLGMQLLATLGTEHGECGGLDWIPGRVDRLPESVGVRVPHIGWNDVRARAGNPLFTEIPPASSFYFVHSYRFLPTDPNAESGTCEHGVAFAVTVQKDNIFGVQFHPEKSHRMGIQLLRNFARVPVSGVVRA